jgi:hypothetical protein
METENQNQTDSLKEQRQLTAEEIKLQEKTIVEFYSNQVKILKHQKEYETILAEIEEARLRRIKATYTIAAITAPPAEENEEVSENSERPVRTLKKD